MVTVNDIFNCLEAFAPTECRMGFDNVGLLVGHRNFSVKRVLTALDITSDVIAEASDIGAQLIVSHHPLFFDIKRVTDDDIIGRKILALAESGAAAICMHTNLDAAKGGVNDALMEALGVQNVSLLADGLGLPETPDNMIARKGTLPEIMTMQEFMADVKFALKSPGLRYHDAGRPVSRVACCGGSGGGELINCVASGCDTLVTSDIKYDVFLSARELGVNIIDAGHFCTENVVIPVLTRLIANAFPDVDVSASECHGPSIMYFV